jgi:N-acyl-D-aspartate/D-glutamate deacylase
VTAQRLLIRGGAANHKTADGEPTPSFDAAERELHMIAGGLARSGSGVLQVITEFPAPDLVPERMRLLIGLARASGRPLSFTLAQFHSAPRSWPEVLRRTEEAHAAAYAAMAGLPLEQRAHDLPSGGRRLTQAADGYRATIVSGAVTRRTPPPA